MREASETSGAESEDQEATVAHAKRQGRRRQWISNFDPVMTLRQKEHMALETRTDTALGAILDMDSPAVERMKARQPVTKYLCIYTGASTEEGIRSCSELPGVKAVLEQLQPVYQAFATETRSSIAHAPLAVGFWSTRIIDGHKGGEWPPFAEICAPADFSNWMAHGPEGK
jgi:hypothetical protein